MAPNPNHAPAPSRTRRILLRLLLLLGSAAGGLLLADRALETWWPVPSMIYRLDPELVFELVPGGRRVLRITSAEGSARIETRIDEAGFRGPGSGRSGPRVLVLGDSLVMAEMTEESQTFVARLAVHLGRENGEAVRTLNAGVSGYGPDQACLRLERELGRMRPDLVVLVLCAHNDFGDLLRDKLFRLDEQGQLARNRWTLDPAQRDFFALQERASRRPALWRALQHEVEARRLRAAEPAPAAGGKPPYLEWYLAAARDEYAEYVVERNDVVRTLFQDYYDADVAIHPEWPSSEYKRRLMERVLARMRAACAGRNVPFVALVVPTSADLCPGFEIHVDAQRYPTWVPERLTDTYMAILRAADVPGLDLFAPFREAGAERLYVGPRDFHWNAAGQELGARRTAGWLRELGLLPLGRKR